MVNLKKIGSSVCIALSLILVFSLSFSAVAKGGETAVVSTVAGRTSCMPGDSFDVTVKIATNYNSVAMRWFVLYSKSVFELVGADGNCAVTDAFGNVGGSVSYNVSGNVSYPAGYSSDEYGVVLIQWVGGGENLAVFNHPDALDCFTFSLKVKDNAALGTTGEIFIPDNSSYYNAALENATDASTYYKATDLACTFNGSSVLVGAAAEPQLIAADGSDAVIDDAAKIIYGFTGGVGSADDVLSCVTALGDGAIAEVDPTDDGYGTGAVVRLVQNGVTVESYSVVYFGDATGDGFIDESDFVVIDLVNAMLYEPDESSAEFLGMDCNRDGVVDESDIVLVDLVNAFMGEIDQLNGGIVLY